MSLSNVDWQTRYGDSRAFESVILRTTVGSQVHGMAISGTDDHDEMGIYVQTPDALLGVIEPKPHLILRTASEGARSYHGDIDLNLYSLRHYLGLAAKGNPSMLLPLYVPDEFVHEAHPLAQELRELAPAFVSLSSGLKFLGYLDSQRERIEGGGKKNRVPKRPELVEKYGFDVKYASHAYRLACQGIQLLRDGRLTLPLEGRDLEGSLGMKSGEFTFKLSLRMIDAKREELVKLIEANPLGVPAYADIEKITAWSVSAHRRYWVEAGL